MTESVAEDKGAEHVAERYQALGPGQSGGMFRVRDLDEEHYHGKRGRYYHRYPLEQPYVMERNEKFHRQLFCG